MTWKQAKTKQKQNFIILQFKNLVPSKDQRLCSVMSRTHQAFIHQITLFLDLCVWISSRFLASTDSFTKCAIIKCNLAHFLPLDVMLYTSLIGFIALKGNFKLPSNKNGNGIGLGKCPRA